MRTRVTLGLVAMEVTGVTLCDAFGRRAPIPALRAGRGRARAGSLRVRRAPLGRRAAAVLARRVAAGFAAGRIARAPRRHGPRVIAAARERVLARRAAGMRSGRSVRVVGQMHLERQLRV